MALLLEQNGWKVIGVCSGLVTTVSSQEEIINARNITEKIYI